MATTGDTTPGSAPRDGPSAVGAGRGSGSTREGDRSSAIAETLRLYLREAPPAGMVSVYLFGSHAAGRAHRQSDVDVGICVDRRVLPTRAARFDLRVRLTSQLIHVLRCNAVDVVVLNDAPPLFARHVLRHGLRLCCAAPDLDRDFRRDVQIRAADLAPFLDRYRRMTLDALGG